MLLGQLIDANGIANAVQQGRAQNQQNLKNIFVGAQGAMDNLKMYEEKQQVQDALKASMDENGVVNQGLMLSNLAKVNPDLAYRKSQQFEQENMVKQTQQAKVAEMQAGVAQTEIQNQKMQFEVQQKKLSDLSKLILSVNDQPGYDKAIAIAQSIGLDTSKLPKQYSSELKTFAFNQLTDMKTQLADEAKRLDIEAKKYVADTNASSRENVANIGANARIAVAGMKGQGNDGITPLQQAKLDQENEKLKFRKEEANKKTIGENENKISALNSSLNVMKSIDDNLNQLKTTYKGVTDNPQGATMNLQRLIGNIGVDTEVGRYDTILDNLNNILQLKGFEEIRKSGAIGSITVKEWEKLASRYNFSRETFLRKTPSERRQIIDNLTKEMSDLKEKTMREIEEYKSKNKSLNNQSNSNNEQVAPKIDPKRLELFMKLRAEGKI